MERKLTVVSRGIILLSSVLVWATAHAGHIENPAPSYETFDDGPYCWEEAREFLTAFGDPIAYCRGHLRFTPGEVDCYNQIDVVCATYSSRHGQRREVRHTRQPAYSIPLVCPAGPKPPQCPGSSPTFRR